jgi:fatty acid-binding protein DegV
VFLPESLNSTLGIGEQGLELAEMNDSGKSFAEIADYIEQNL